ncbi:MAG: beta-ketoacyl-[acyl-carrier-protein] synthase II, partial [Ectothiorhodospiraceae bacterium]
EGLGARLAMERALARAQCAPEAVDYVNLHGTATPINDAVEDRAVHGVFGGDTPCSSTKGWTGHLLGAAGMVEALFTGLCLRGQFIPGSLNTRSVDPSFRSRVATENRDAALRVAMSNSFGFGGNNCSVVLGRSA